MLESIRLVGIDGQFPPVAHAILHDYLPGAWVVGQPSEAPQGIGIAYLVGIALGIDDPHLGEGHGFTAGVFGGSQRGLALGLTHHHTVRLRR
ncbi:MAG: hypothetical protein HY910_06470 [Desulfarculus sp.]|nr:hypothetical protein [Desulfarculus sp.]